MQLTAPATKVFLLPPKQVVTALPPLAETCYDQLRAGFALQTTHLLTDDPGSADLILAPIQNAGYGLRFEALRSSKIYQPYAGKLIVYSPDDNQFPSLRGLYPAAPLRWVRRGWALPAHYISSHIHRFSFSADEAAQKDLLFSFVGSSRTHPIREKILQWRHPRAVVLDSSSKSDRHYWWEKENKDDLLDSFREITRRSRFVVCPRGVSASSIRLFEAIEASSVPVIVADDLALPLGPNWEEFSIRVREREIDDVPRLIEHYADRAFEMGAAARRAWETYFSPEASIGSVVAWARLLLAHSPRRPLRLQIEELTRPQFAAARLGRAVRLLPHPRASNHHRI